MKIQKSRDSLKASVNVEYFKEFNQNFDSQIIEIEHFLALDKNENIIGITGIYTIKENYKKGKKYKYTVNLQLFLSLFL